MGEGGGTEVPIIQEAQRQKTLYEKFSSISKNKEYRSLNLNNLNLILFLGDFNRKVVDLDLEGDYQELMYQLSTKSLAEELSISKKELIFSREKLNKMGLVQRVEHNHYKGRVFIDLTDEGSELYYNLIE